MIYFSELRGKSVFTEDIVYVGKLDDLIFLVSEKPKITKLVILSKTQGDLVIPQEYLKKINTTLVIQKDFNTSELQENELYILRNILDKQIIDLVGHKVVRVNDVAIQDKGELYVAGVDIGLLGVFRQFGMERFLIKSANSFGVKLTPRFLSWADIQPLELARGKVQLRKEEEKLQKMRAEDLADYLEKTNIVNVRKILRILDEKFAAEVIGNLNINYQTSLFKHFSSEKAAKVLSYIDPDEAVDILLTFHKKKRDEILSLMDHDQKKVLKYLLSLPQTPIGDILTTEYVTVYPENTSQEVIHKIKDEAADFASLYHIYVVNKENQIMGVFNLHELLVQNSDIPVYKFMVQNVIVVHLTTSKEIVLKKMLKYKIVALPVIDKERHMIGLVSIDDIMEFIFEKAII